MNSYNYFFDTASDRVCFVNMEANTGEVNQDFATVLGYSTSDLCCKSLFDLIHPEDVDPTKAEIKKLELGVGIVHFKNRCKMKSGEYTNLEWSVRANNDLRQLHATARLRSGAGGNAGQNQDASPGPATFVNDLSEKEELAAKLLIANKELLSQNAEMEKRALELVVANKELLYLNAEKEKRASELVIANRELIFQNAEKEKRAGELIIANRELDFQNNEREKKAQELRLAYENLENAEDGLRKLNSELEQKVKDRTLQLESINSELEAFSYSVSHDLRAPIRAISAYSNIISEECAGGLDEEGLKALNSIIQNSKRMGELIDDLLAFSKLGRKEVRMSEINMTALVKSVREEMIIDIENVPDFTVGDLPPALGDSSLIKQVLVNLISNAIKYSRYRETITIHIGSYVHDGMTVYFIKDNGAGFDMEYYNQLFGVFQRLHSSDEFEGTGIGLAIVQKIVRRHQGNVWAESKPEEGACFYFSLPSINN